MNNPNRGDFERMVELAEFGARRHDERRQVEFRVFIAYNTLLALAFYHVSKDTTTQPLVNLPEWSIALILGGIHFVYFLWQIRLARALVNDTSRRNFYLKKAECLLHHLCEDPNNRIHPRTDRYVKVDNHTTKNEISEYELFKMHEPYIVLVSPMWKFWGALGTTLERLVSSFSDFYSDGSFFFTFNQNGVGDFDLLDDYNLGGIRGDTQTF